MYVQVVWDEWDDVSNEERGRIIMDAYEQARPDDLLRITMGAWPDHGRRDIPAEAIMRRYAKSVCNLRDLYLPLGDYAAVWDNSEEKPRRVYERDEAGERIFDEQKR